MRYLLVLAVYLFSNIALADQNIVNNCNNNIQTDPRVPPAGTYSTATSDVYTTGETKPYIIDNSCNSNSSSSAAQPNVFLTPRR